MERQIERWNRFFKYVGQLFQRIIFYQKVILRFDKRLMIRISPMLDFCAPSGKLYVIFTWFWLIDALFQRYRKMSSM